MGDKVNDKGKISKNELDDNDVFVLDSGFHLYIWTGKKASKAERVKALFLTEKYLRESDRPDVLPITEIKQSHSDRSIYQNFDSHFYLPKDKSCCVVM
jgi:gelsolin